MADGLFSYQTPGQLQQEYLSNLIQPVGGGDLYSQLVQTMSNAGRMMGYGAGRMFGGQVPGEAKNAAIQSVFEQVKDIQDPAQQYTAASQLFLKAGFPDLAMQARKTAQTEQLTGYKVSDAERAQNLQKAIAAIPPNATPAQRATLLNNAIRQFGTPEQVTDLAKEDTKAAREAATQQAKLTTISSLVPNINPKLAAGLASPEGEKAYTEFLTSQIKTKAPDTEIGKLLAARDALPPGHPNRKVYDARILKLTDTNNPNSALEKMADALVKATVGAAGKEVGTSVAQLPTQEEAAGYIDRALNLLDKGIYSGFYGKAQETVTAATGGAVGSEKRLTNTQIFRNYIGQVVIPRLKEFGGNDSVEELRFLERVEGGDTSITEEALRATLESAKQKIQRGIRLKRIQEKAISEGKTPPMSLPQEKTKPVTKKRYNPATGKVEVVKE